MPISVSIKERDALFDLVKDQMGTLQDVWTLLENQEWDQAQSAFDECLQDHRFLEYLHLEEPDENGQINVGMRMEELRETITRIQIKASVQLVIEGASEEATPEREAAQKRARLAVRVCERSLKTFHAQRYAVRYVVVDTETGEVTGWPTSLREAAMDMAEVFDESSGQQQ